MKLKKLLKLLRKKRKKIQNEIEVYDKKFEKRFVELENKYRTSVFKFIEKNNEKVLQLESSLKEALDKLENKIFWRRIRNCTGWKIILH